MGKLEVLARWTTNGRQTILYKKEMSDNVAIWP